MAVLHLLSGIPGCGKSTLSARIPGYVVSTDRIRKFLWGDESVVAHDTLVFDIAEDMARYLLQKGVDVILDATNLTVAKRGRFIKGASAIGARVILHWLDCPLEIAIQRNAGRRRKVPVNIIKSLHRSFQAPSPKEGIRVIKLYNHHLQLEKVFTEEITIKRGKINLLKK